MSVASEPRTDAGVDVVGPDAGPMARLEVVVAGAETPSVVFQRVAEGETLKAIARAWGLPVGRFTQWVMEEHAELYDAALKVRADQLAHDALAVAGTPQPGVTKKTKADGTVEVTEEDMLGHRRLHSETMLKLAGKWDRARYGEHMKVERTVSVTADAGLIGLAGELLERISRAQEKVVLPAPEPDADDTLI